MRRMKPSELSASEQAVYGVQLEEFINKNKSESSLTDTIAELVSATVNQSVIDLLSPPTSTSVKLRSRKAECDKAYVERHQDLVRKDAKRFIDSEDLTDYLSIIKRMGRSGANARVIRKLCKEYEAQGKYLFISQSYARVMTQQEWAEFQMANVKTRLSNSKKAPKPCAPQENAHAETIEVPLENDRLSA